MEIVVLKKNTLMETGLKMKCAHPTLKQMIDVTEELKKLLPLLR